MNSWKDENVSLNVYKCKFFCQLCLLPGENTSENCGALAVQEIHIPSGSGWTQLTYLKLDVTIAGPGSGKPRTTYLKFDGLVH